MKKIFIGFLLATLTGYANSQTVLDGSGKNIPSGLVKSLNSSLGMQFKDPISIQLRNLAIKNREGSPAVCGELNAKNGFGGYVGFSPFFYIQGAQQVGLLDTSMASPDFRITLDNSIDVIMQSATAKKLEDLGCIPPGLSAEMQQRVDAHLNMVKRGMAR
jgi:hypothetical protein